MEIFVAYTEDNEPIAAFLHEQIAESNHQSTTIEVESVDVNYNNEENLYWVEIYGDSAECELELFTTKEEIATYLTEQELMEDGKLYCEVGVGLDTVDDEPEETIEFNSITDFSNILSYSNVRIKLLPVIR